MKLVAIWVEYVMRIKALTLEVKITYNFKFDEDKSIFID